MFDGIRNEAQVFCDNLQIGNFLFDGLEKAVTGAFHPLPVPGRLLGMGNRIIFIKAAEVVDADDIVKLFAPLHARNPPGIAGLLVVLPVVDGIAPALAVDGESIGRAARDIDWSPVRVHLEEVGIGPDVRTIFRHIDGDVTDDGNALLVRVLLQGLPLPLELELEELVEADFAGIGFLGPGIGLLLPKPDVVIPGLEGSPAVRVLQGHEEGVVLDPVLVLLHELPEVLVLLDSALQIGLPQNRIAIPVQGPVVNGVRAGPEVRPRDVGLLQPAVFNQLVQVDEIRIPRIAGKTLVGRIPVGRRPQRKNLPQALAGLRQEVHEIIGLLRKAADPVLRRQRKHRHQNACRPSDFLSLHDVPLL